jgi:hypothetical protein
MLAFGGQSGRLIGEDWHRPRRKAARDGRKAGRASSSVKGSDSWGMRPVQLLKPATGDARPTSPERGAVDLSASASDAEVRLEAAARRAAARLESSASVAPRSLYARKTVIEPAGLPGLLRPPSRGGTPGADASAPGGLATGRSPSAPPRYNASPALATQVGQQQQQQQLAVALPWHKLPVASTAFPAHGQRIWQEATAVAAAAAAAAAPGQPVVGQSGGSAGRQKGARSKRQAKMEEKTMRWLATRCRQSAADQVQERIDAFYAQPAADRDAPAPDSPKKKKKKKKSRKAQERARKRREEAARQAIITAGVQDELNRWASIEAARAAQVRRHHRRRCHPLPAARRRCQA